MHLRDRKKLKGDNYSFEMPDIKQTITPSGSRVLDLNRIVTAASVQHLIPFEGPYDPRNTKKVSPLPRQFKTTSKSLMRLRADEIWNDGTREQQLQQMEQWFPDVPRRVDGKVQDVEPHKSIHADETTDVEMDEITIETPSAPSRAPGCSASSIGYFSKLPGELRNRIYRLAVLEHDKSATKIKMETATCSQGICLHTKLTYNIPGIANTCRQMRWEALPIFLAENSAINFDDGMVHQCCVGNWLKTLGHYADVISEFQFMLMRPIWNNDHFVEYANYTFTLATPNAPQDPGLSTPRSSTEKMSTQTDPSEASSSESDSEMCDSETSIDPCRCGKWTLWQYEPGSRKVCQCALNKLIEKMNERWGEVPTGQEVIDFADSEEFADFVWRMRKSKQWPQTLAKCKKCKEVVFNS